ncbi:MAG TPA: FAD-binding protein [Bdellovibrionota bacterium]|nr:FAD-binding protein [Bdellovibrionota bacterium]
MSCDFLVLGGGLAGGLAALKAAEAGLDVVLVKDGTSATSWAQGGIVYRAPGDPEVLIRDIFEAGAHINNPRTVELVAREAPALVQSWLIDKLNVGFDVGSGGEEELVLEAAHSSARILHTRDSTGRSIQDALDRQVDSHPNIKTIRGALVDLLLSDRNAEDPACAYRKTEVMGAYVLLLEDGSGGKQNEIIPLVAAATLIATGGYSHLYYHASGPTSSVGAGIAVAQRAGAKILHMEFEQFHPTCLYIPHQPRRLLTEALRGAGAKLLSESGERFVDELAPRDVVSRAIHDEMLKSQRPHVWLDLRGIENFSEKFPAIDALLKSHDLNAGADLIPVVPAAHYSIGGIWTDTTARTSVPRLWAAGEAACTGLHGANRLASTSLLEALYFGERAATAVIAEIHELRRHDFVPRAWMAGAEDPDPALILQDWEQLRHTLWNYVGLVRSPWRLRRAQKILTDLRNETESFYKRSRITPELLKLRHGALVATLILYAAIRRRHSVGVHYVVD